MSVHALKIIKEIIGHTGARRYPGVAAGGNEDGWDAGVRWHETIAKFIRDL